MTTKKVMLKVEVHEDKIKQKAMKAVSGISGVESVSVNMKDKTLTLTGDIDPIQVVAKLKKFCHTEIVLVGPAKEEKKEEPKNNNKKKEDDKKDSKEENVPYPLNFCLTYPRYYLSMEEDPNSCVII